MFLSDMSFVYLLFPCCSVRPRQSDFLSGLRYPDDVCHGGKIEHPKLCLMAGFFLKQNVHLNDKSSLNV